MPSIIAYELANASGCGVESEVLLFSDVGESSRYVGGHSFDCIARFYFDENSGWEMQLPVVRRESVPWRAFESAMKHLRRSSARGFSNKHRFKNYRFLC